LRNGVGAIQKENRDLFISLLADIDHPMNTTSRFVPVCLACRDLEMLALGLVALLDRQCLAAEDHRDAMEPVSVPACRLARSKAQPPNEGLSAAM
jgi:hypothetical protein